MLLEEGSLTCSVRPETTFPEGDFHDHPVTSVVTPGMRARPANVERTVRAASAGALEECQLTTLRRRHRVVDFD